MVSSGEGQVVDQGMEILRSFAKGSYNNPLDVSKSCKLGLDWSSRPRSGPTVQLVSGPGLLNVLPIQLTRPLVHCSCGLLSLAARSVPRPRAFLRDGTSKEVEYFDLSF